MKETTNKLASYLNALRPIIYINHFDFTAVDALIREAGEIFGNDHQIHEYNDAFGYVDFQWKNPKNYGNNKQDLATFLTPFYEQEGENFLVLKDIHFHLENPEIIALLKAIALKTLNPKQDNFRIVIFIVASKLIIPRELEHFITVFDFPLLTETQIAQIINEFTRELDLTINSKIVDELALSFKGLTEFEIKQILYLAYEQGGNISLNDKQFIIQEKEQIIKKTGTVEIVNFKETINDIGGLENLKKWLNKKAKIFKELDKAREYGVDIPKGLMLIGMPGCGKSLVAKATSRLFEMPLLRLDIGKLLGKYVGESEENFRQAIKIAEAVSPCILWIDEIEKAFAGIGDSSGGGDVTTRLFGSFLTWLQEKENTVFVVATANDISKFPPEFLRKGRFDELFSVTFPNEDERKNIFKIHLTKRGKWHDNININTLIENTKNFSGADIEAVVKETIENAFINNQEKLKTEDLLTVIKTTQPLSKSLGDKIKIIEDSLKKFNFKSAT